VILAGRRSPRSARARLPLFGYVAIALLLVGTVMLMPRIAVLAFGSRPLSGRVCAAGARAAARGAGAGRVSLAAIVAAVSLMVSMAIMVASFRQSLDEWLERILPATCTSAPGRLRHGVSVPRRPAGHRAPARDPANRVHARAARQPRSGQAVAHAARQSGRAEGRVPPLLGRRIA